MKNSHLSAISVVVPVYNAEPYLKECMESVCSQSFPDLEIICVNDGSTDNSLQILGDYAARDSRIRVIDSPNGGYGKAMNIGMDAASGKYLAILEPDDYLPPHAYERLYSTACAHDLDLVKGCYTPFKGDPSQYRHGRSSDLVQPGKVLCPADHPEWFLLFRKKMLNIWTGLYRLEWLRTHHIRFHESPGASYQDRSWFCITIAKSERFMCIPEIVYHYRRDNSGSSTAPQNYQNKPLDVFHREYLYVLWYLREGKSRQQKFLPYVFLDWMDAAKAHYDSISSSERQKGYMALWKQTLTLHRDLLHPLEKEAILILKEEIKKQEKRIFFSLPKVRKKRQDRIKYLTQNLIFFVSVFNCNTTKLI